MDGAEPKSSLFPGAEKAPIFFEKILDFLPPFCYNKDTKSKGDAL
jgi:hypothetical protein